MALHCIAVFHAAFLALAALPISASAKGFLVERKGSLRSTADANSFQTELRNAMGEALGCGGHVGKETLAEIEKALRVMWQTLPKNSKGRVERRSLRYLVHRFFYKKSALLVRGFEPSRPTNASSWGRDDILSQRVPAYVESVLESKHAHDNGFSLDDAVLMVATVEQLIFDSESSLLEKVYSFHHKPVDRSLSDKGLEQLMEDYMAHWMLGDDEEGIKMVMSNKALLKESIPHWDQIVSFAQGQIRALDFQRERSPAAASRPGHNALAKRYSFDDAHQVVGGITRSFASFWDSECASMKASLVQMDAHGTGRVPLSKFYSSALDSEWRFGESESYLRELGALDETSSWYGKQVIIPNYMQAASNCIVTSTHYLVCCVNECEVLLGELEEKLRAETARPEEILAVVANMSSQTTVDHDEPPHLDASLRSQLTQIASSHGGRVPLHGRLFAQWLHYVFPRECPFPHKVGSTASTTPLEYGDSFIASKDEMKKHASDVTATEAIAEMGKEELQWMSQWSHEEELIADYSGTIRAPWESRHFAVCGIMLLLACGAIGTMGFGRRMMNSDAALLPTHSKAHFV